MTKLSWFGDPIQPYEGSPVCPHKTLGNATTAIDGIHTSPCNLMPFNFCKHILGYRFPEILYSMDIFVNSFRLNNYLKKFKCFKSPLFELWCK